MSQNCYVDIVSVTQIDGNDYEVVSERYSFDENGVMFVGWWHPGDNIFWYFITDTNQDIGKQAVGWKLIDGKYYYFGADGNVFLDTVTPDGYLVDEKGVWIDQ